MTKSTLGAILFLAVLLITGCVSSTQKTAISQARTKNDLATSYYKKASQLEQNNKLVEAKKNYHLSITADPTNQNARHRLKIVNTSLKNRAQMHYEKSLVLKKEGKYAQATRFLRIALRYWPDHEKARKDLVADQQIHIQNYIWHTIKKGESLSLISKAYYGSTELSSILAKVNHIKDATKIGLGMKLKIPQLEKYPFRHQAAKPPAPSLKKPSSKKSIEPEVNPLVMYKTLGIEFFDSKKFKNAIIEFKKILTSNPDDKDTIRYIRSAYTHLGTAALNDRQYVNAIDYFQSALNNDKACVSCKKGIEKSQDLYKEFHYKAGMKFFDEQNLALAVSEWDLVFIMDPDYKRTSELLDKVKTIQKNINALKQSQ